jgi:hypothetical protein
MKSRIILLCTVIVTAMACASSAFATLLNVNPTFPKFSYNNISVFSQTYTASNELFTINSAAQTVFFASGGAPSIIHSGNLQIQVAVDNNGNLVGGAPGDGGNDFILSGTVTQGTNSYSGVLLTGTVFGFGYLNSGGTSVTLYDFRFTPTGGALAGLFCGNIAVQVTSGDSTFNNNFTVNFNGQAKGTIGSEDTTSPTIVCPTNIVAECHFTNGLAGAYVNYPNPVVADNCDPNPTVVCTPPSGSFFALPPPPANSTNYTVTCVATDASGNTNTCSFTITVQDTMPPEFADPNNPVIQSSLNAPIMLTNSASECSATFTFPVPTAMDCCGNTDTVTVSAIDENGDTITLTNIGSGLLQGVFPVDQTGTNIITIVADDGRGNQTEHQAAVEVVDVQPPTLVCSDQTATFKPILTNALSCISANFQNLCIVSNQYIWFSSVIQNPACYYRGSFTVHVFSQTIQLCIDNTNLTLNVPDAYVTFSNGVATTSTVFTNGDWITITKPGLQGNTFVSGLAWKVPFSLNNTINNRFSGYCWGKDNYNPCNSRCTVESATWCARFAVNTPGVVIQWQWGAVVENNLTTNYNLCGVKPVDDGNSSCFRNCDPAGSCENFKSCLVSGACGRGWYYCGRTLTPDCTGILSACQRANLGMGSICEGAVEFTPPMAVDNCGGAVTVVCTPPPGTVLGPGTYPVTAVATDASGNTNTCTFNLTVVPPLQVVFDCPANDNLDDNSASPDSGYSDMNCPDSPGTTEYVTPFKCGSTVLHCVRLLDCNGNDVTCQEAPYVTVHMDVTERVGCYTNSTVVSIPSMNYNWIGSPGGIMVPCNGEFEYNLNTSGYQTGTLNTDVFFRSCVWVEYNSSPGVPVGLEDVILQSQ